MGNGRRDSRFLLPIHPIKTNGNYSNMLFTTSILVDSHSRVIAFCGEKKRLSLIHRLSEEISRRHNKVIITSPGFRKFSTIGKLIIERETPVLFTRHRTEFEEHPVIHAGKEIEDELVIGFDYSDVAFLKDHIPENYYLLYDVSNDHDQLFCRKRQISAWVKETPWHQLVYYFNITHLDQPLEAFSTSEIKSIRKRHPTAATLSQDILIELFTNPSWGMGKMFQQNWQTVLFLAGVENVRLENRAIQLARALQDKGLSHIVIGNMKTLSVQRITKTNDQSNNNSLDN